MNFKMIIGFALFLAIVFSSWLFFWPIYLAVDLQSIQPMVDKFIQMIIGFVILLISFVKGWRLII